MNRFVYMSLGGGVQSGTMAEMIAEGELDKPDAVIFADTGNEPQYVYEYVDYLTKRLAVVGVPVYTVSGGNLIQTLKSGEGRFAAIPAYTLSLDGKRGTLRRQCTREYKITPIEKQVRALLVEKGYAQRGKGGRVRVPYTKVAVEAWLGISMDEVARMKPSRTSWITNRWPLIEKRMSRQDCLRWLEKKGLPIPKKSSCLICPFHSADYWREMRAEQPDDWASVVDFDNSLRDKRSSRFKSTAKGTLYLYNKMIPLQDIDVVDSAQMLIPYESELDVCDEGYCFI